MNQKEFVLAVKKIYPCVSETFFKQIEVYKSFLQAQNKLFNLTNLASEELIYEEYFLASIIPYQNINFSNGLNVLDIGSGSGIPGILLKLLYPSINLTILEVNTKKVNFMKKLAEKLNINVSFLFQRAEDIKNHQREQFDLVTSRAVAELRILLEISAPYAKVNGLILEPKSIKYKEEITNAKKIINDLALSPLPIQKFIGSKSNYLLSYKKLKVTPNKFPQTWKEIIK